MANDRKPPATREELLAIVHLYYPQATVEDDPDVGPVISFPTETASERIYFKEEKR